MPHKKKKSYLTKRDAERSQNRTGIGGWLRVYYCTECRAWHLTSQARRSKEES